MKSKYIIPIVVALFFSAFGSLYLSRELAEWRTLLTFVTIFSVMALVFFGVYLITIFIPSNRKR